MLDLPLQVFHGWVLLPTAALAFPNPLMPAEVSLNHFWEVSISMGIFGALSAWFVPKLSEIRLPALHEQSTPRPKRIRQVFENAGFAVDYQAH